ncbi:MAG: exo-alpha-sialidase [Oscillospiraceae bacterium]|nr:exo-alpha-sialidase [Oscillospiraceae bacterium]
MKIIESKTIYKDGEYPAFPNLAKLHNGQIICAFRHALDRQKQYGRHTHVDPTAKDVFIVSPDGGNTFDPDLHVILDDEMSEQDPCVNVLSDGRILVTYFRWQLVPIGKGPETWGKENFEFEGRSLHGLYDCYVYGTSWSISDDNGATWRHMPVIRDPNIPEAACVRGNIVEMPDGTLLLPYYGSLAPKELSRIGLMRSTDRGESWQYFSEMAYDGDGFRTFVEPFLYLTESGRLVCLIRTQSDYNKKGLSFDDTYLNLHITVSEDGGKTFGPVEEIPSVYASNPFHALRLQSGRVLVTYGYRRAPFGMRAKLCNAELTDLNEAEEIILRDDAATGDVGYPNAIQLDNGDILVAYYFNNADHLRSIEVTRLRED